MRLLFYTNVLGINISYITHINVINEPYLSVYTLNHKKFSVEYPGSNFDLFYDRFIEALTGNENIIMLDDLIADCLEEE